MAYSRGYDLSASPDPLNDDSVYTSPIKSQKSQRVVRRSVSVISTSPRKQMFELDVGNRVSPQKIIVTVEADLSNKENHMGIYKSVEASPSPIRRRAPVTRRNERTTTTTVPLKGLTDDEGDRITTPARTPGRGRGRPRKSAGTPIVPRNKRKQVTPGRRRSADGMLEIDSVEQEVRKAGVGASATHRQGRGQSTSTAARNDQTTTAQNKSTRGRLRRKPLEVPDVPEDEVESIAESVDLLREFDRDSPILDADNGSGSMTRPLSVSRSPPSSNNNDEDILLAEFGRDQTPIDAGWSSPNISSATRQINSSWTRYLSQTPRAMPQETKGVEYDTELENDNTIQSYISQQQQTEREGESDIVMEEEGFTMVSMTSAHVLHELVQSPMSEGSPRDSVLPVPSRRSINRERSPGNDSLASYVAETMAITTAAGISQTRSSLQTQPTNQRTAREPSFNSIESRIVNVTSPGRVLILPKQRNSKTRSSSIHSDDSLSIVAQPTVEEQTPRTIPRNRMLFQNGLRNENNDDSFSSIPSTILEAASPQKRQMVEISPPVGSHEMHMEGHTTMESIQPIPQDETVLVAERESSHLPTPDDTPSDSLTGDAMEPMEDLPVNEESARPTSAHSQHIQHSPVLHPGSSSAASHFRSSPPSMLLPPRSTFPSQVQSLRSNNFQIKETPTVLLSSPSLPPPAPHIARSPSTGGAGNAGLDFPSIRRAGRALQEVTVPSSSARSRSQSLGSPFKSPSPSRRSESSSSQQRQTVQENQAGSNIERPLVGRDVVADKVFKSSEKSRGRQTHHKTMLDNPLGNSARSQSGPTSADSQGNIQFKIASKSIARFNDLSPEVMVFPTMTSSAEDPTTGQDASNQIVANQDQPAIYRASLRASQIEGLKVRSPNMSFVEQPVSNNSETFARPVSMSDTRSVPLIEPEDRLATAKMDKSAEEPKSRRVFKPKSLLQLREEDRAGQLERVRDVVRLIDEDRTVSIGFNTEPSPQEMENENDKADQALEDDDFDISEALLAAGQEEEPEEDGMDIWLAEARNSSLLEASQVIEEPIVSEKLSSHDTTGEVARSTGRNERTQGTRQLRHSNRMEKKGPKPHRIVVAKEQTPVDERSSEERRLEYMSSVPQVETSRILDSFISSRHSNASSSPMPFMERKSDPARIEPQPAPITALVPTLSAAATVPRDSTPSTSSSTPVPTQSRMGRGPEGQAERRLTPSPAENKRPWASKKRHLEREIESSQASPSQLGRNKEVHQRENRRRAAAELEPGSHASSTSQRINTSTHGNIGSNTVDSSSSLVDHIQCSSVEAKVAVTTTQPASIVPLITQSAQPVASAGRVSSDLYTARPVSPNMMNEDYSELSQLQETLVSRKASFAPRVRHRDARKPLDISALLALTPAKPDHAATVQENHTSQTVQRESVPTGSRRPSNFIPSPPTSQEKDDEALAEHRSSSLTQWDSTTYPVKGSIERSVEEPVQGPTRESVEESFEETYEEEEALSSQPHTPERSSLIYSLLDNVAPLPPSAATPSPKKSCIRAVSRGETPRRNVIWNLDSSFADSSSIESSSNIFDESSIDVSVTDQLLSRGAFVKPTSRKTISLKPHPLQQVQVPVPPSSLSRPQLSNTTWSHQHWLLLDSIWLDVRSTLPLPEDLEAEYANSKLLGVSFEGKGERMTVEAWHLDVVACFLDDVPGWDEEFLVKRVFGLVKAEERRIRRGQE